MTKEELRKLWMDLEQLAMELLEADFNNNGIYPIDVNDAQIVIDKAQIAVNELEMIKHEVG